MKSWGQASGFRARLYTFAEFHQKVGGGPGATPPPAAAALDDPKDVSRKTEGDGTMTEVLIISFLE